MMKFFGRNKTKAASGVPSGQGKPGGNVLRDIRLTGRGGELLYEGPLNGLSFPEKLIIAKSIYFFNDEEPCFIHRSAVAARLFEELNLLLEKKGKMSAAELQGSAQGYLDEYPGWEYIESPERPDR
ncbi:MAG: hypothetical protein LBO80_05800 [Treponema sp.]|jgi:hypothetical protein|nr:hypothetical protein [Treponema sp.]